LTPNQLHNLNIERAILSAIIFEPTLYEDVASKLSPEDFYLPDHQVIFQCMEELDREEQPIDEEFLKKKLLQKKRYNEDVFIEIISANPISNVTAYVEEIKEKAIKRELVKLTSRIREVTVEDDLPSDDILNIVQKELYEISLDANTKEFRESPEMVAATIAHIHEMKKRGNNGVTGVDTGFRELNELTAGFGEGQLIIIAARPAMGKCLAKGTKVLMYDGSLKAVEDIERGELLMGDDSTPRKVLSIARGRERMYWIRQKKGIDYRVNESHILSLKCSRNKDDKPGDVRNISVRDYLQKSDKFKSRYKGYKVPVKFMEKDLGIEPYFLGLWLGEGRKSELRKLGVLENKHIPNDYLINSTQKRLELLAGLIDSSGHYDKQCNSYEITRISKSLAGQIKFLADSLGFRTSLKKKKSAIKAGDFKGVVYRVRIFGDIDRVPVKTARKKARPWVGKQSWSLTEIKVEFDKVDDYYGFEIDGNSLFLLEDMTVTHNTAFTLNLAQKALDDNRGVAIFSLEMPAEELMLRMLSAKTSIPLQNLKVGDLTDEEWSHLSRATDEMAQKKLFVDDDGLININQLRSKLRKIKTQNPEISLAIIDYLQLMSGTGSKDRHLEVSEISRGLKLLARELQIPIIALSQLNRGLESRHDKRPMLSDIRESGSIEQDADIIMFVYRDDVYKMREEKEKEKRAKAEGKEYKSEFVAKAEEEAEVIIGKNRSGPIGTAHLVFQKRFTRFVDKGNVPVEIVFENAEENAKNSKIELPPI
jgi:replicative DNA helicase